MRRIQRDKSHEEFIEFLVSGDQAIFRDRWRLLLFAAALGVKREERTPLGEVDSGKAIPANYFSSPGWKGFLYLLGFLDSETSDHLKNDEKEQESLITAFEEYANAGLSVMSKAITSSADPLGELVALIEDSTQQELANPDISI